MATRALWVLLFIIAALIYSEKPSDGVKALRTRLEAVKIEISNIRMSGITTAKPLNLIGINKVHW